MQIPSVLLRPKGVSLEERYLFARQLHVLQKAGVPLLSSLHSLQMQLPAGSLKRTLRAVYQDLLNGYTLTQAFARYPSAFDPVFVGMIRAGEAGGLLEEMLKRLSELFEWELELRAKIRQALQYPFIVLAILAVALAIMVSFVLPRFAQFFNSLNVQLPLQTRLIIGASRFIVHYGWLLGLGFVCAAFFFWRYIHTGRGRFCWHRLLLRLPVLGAVFAQLGMSRFARTTSALIASGLPMLQTLALAEENVNNSCIQQGLAKVRERVKGGEALSKALSTDSLFPSIVVQMVSTGEETGQFEDLLKSVSEYYDQQASYLIKRLTTFIEPALLIVVGLGVLLMASSVLVPMWDMVRLFKQTGG